MSIDPRPTTDLADVAAWPFEDGAEEIVIRVSRYSEADINRPGCFQAIVKHRDRTRIWGVGIKACPVAALLTAISRFYERAGDGWPDGGAHGTSREPVIEEPEIDMDIDVEDLLG